MFAFAYAIKSYLQPLVALQVAQQTLANAGFQIFDVAQPGKVTVGGTHPGAGILVTAVSIDCEGGSATVINAFCPHQAAAPSAQQMAETVFATIQAS
ncbi:MAG: hypothetical protein LW698_01265 [Planctomycetaceae bacterium]|jgi:hypothetical protein|nr:hypothetical protein [Planctomycetaceae bacterium]